jgi:hypothetical protein
MAAIKGYPFHPIKGLGFAYGQTGPEDRITFFRTRQLLDLSFGP